MFHREKTKMDEFSFPTIEVHQDSLHQLPHPHFANSPLWSASSVAHNAKKTGHRRRRSFPSASKPVAVSERESKVRHNEIRGDMFTVDEEKMDKLWEDFNEDLIRVSPNVKSGTRADAAVDIEQRGAELSSMIQHRRPILLLMLKVLKKLFVVGRTTASKRHHFAKYKIEHCT